MGMTITNLTEVIMALKLVDTEVNDAAREALIKGGEQIRDTARKFAPVDEFRLEDSIHLLPNQGNRYMLRVTVAATGSYAGADGKVRSVDVYAAIVHEYPWSKRGPLTRFKSPRAGPRYLSRAVREHEKKILRDLSIAMGRGISKGLARSGASGSKKKKRRR